MNQKKNKKWKALLLVAGLLGITAAGGTMAYFTDYEETVNQFTVGKIQIELTEPHWKPEENTTIVPGQKISKDPQITNKGINDAFVYMEVSVPIRNVLTAQPDGTKKDRAETELFTYTVNNQWTKLSEKSQKDYNVYTYVYNHILNPEKTTPALFETVTFANLVEGQLEEQEISIPVRAFAIQSDNTGDDKTTVLEQATAAYQKYVNQNPDVINTLEHQQNNFTEEESRNDEVSR